MSAKRPITRSMIMVAFSVLVTLVLIGTTGGAEPGAVSKVEIVATERSPESDRQSLVGLSGVHVKVSGVIPESAPEELNEVMLQGDVEMRLRKVGIRVLNREEVLQAPGTPQLTLKVTTHPDQEGLFYAFGIELVLVQDVVLLRDAKIVGRGTTWGTGTVGLVGTQSLRNIRFHVWEKVDQFANDYRAANQKR